MSNRVPRVIYSEIPKTHKYSEVWDLQKHLHAKLVQSKRNGALHSPGYLLLCEHSPVYTLGKSGKIEHLKVPQSALKLQQTEFFKINRGGDITYHGPGQITGYPILDLDQYYNDVHRYVRELEEVVVITLKNFGVKGQRLEGYTGVWIIDDGGKRKICAIGVHMSRWVTLHGFALNVNTDLNYFNQIIPCGIADTDTSVTSLSNELQKTVELSEVKQMLKSNFRKVFGFNYLDED